MGILSSTLDALTKHPLKEEETLDYSEGFYEALDDISSATDVRVGNSSGEARFSDESYEGPDVVDYVKRKLHHDPLNFYTDDNFLVVVKKRTWQYDDDGSIWREYEFREHTFDERIGDNYKGLWRSRQKPIFVQFKINEKHENEV